MTLPIKFPHSLVDAAYLKRGGKYPFDKLQQQQTNFEWMAIYMHLYVLMWQLVFWVGWQARSVIHKVRWYFYKPFVTFCSNKSVKQMLHGLDSNRAEENFSGQVNYLCDKLHMLIKLIPVNFTAVGDVPV